MSECSNENLLSVPVVFVLADEALRLMFEFQYFSPVHRIDKLDQIALLVRKLHCPDFEIENPLIRDFVCQFLVVVVLFLCLFVLLLAFKKTLNARLDISLAQINLAV